MATDRTLIVAMFRASTASRAGLTFGTCCWAAVAAALGATDALNWASSFARRRRASDRRVETTEKAKKAAPPKKRRALRLVGDADESWVDADAGVSLSFRGVSSRSRGLAGVEIVDF